MTTFGQTLGELFRSPAFLTMAATPFVALGASALQSGVTSMMENRERVTNYKAMLDMHPELRRHKDPEFLNRAYTSLTRANPHVAKDPFVAGSIMLNITAGHEHVSPGEAKRMFLTELDRAIGQRGSFRSGPEADLGKTVTEVGRAFSAGLGELEKGHTEANHMKAELQNWKTTHAAQKEREALLDAERRLQDAAYSAQTRTRDLQKQERAFTRLTGVAPNDGPQGVPSVRARKFLRDAAATTVDFGLGKRKPSRP